MTASTASKRWTRWRRAGLASHKQAQQNVSRHCAAPNHYERRQEPTVYRENETVSHVPCQDTHRRCCRRACQRSPFASAPSPSSTLFSPSLPLSLLGLRLCVGTYSYVCICASGCLPPCPLAPVLLSLPATRPFPPAGSHIVGISTNSAGGQSSTVELAMVVTQKMLFQYVAKVLSRSCPVVSVSCISIRVLFHLVGLPFAFGFLVD